MSVHCRILNWDSEFFGLNIARVEGGNLQRGDLPELLAWCHAERIDCLYFLADMRCMETGLAVEKGGFALKDVRVTYELRNIVNRASASVPEKQGIAVRPSTPADLPAIEQIAGEAHSDTRFFYDAGFPREAARLLYQVWIRQSCFSPTGTVLVLVAENGIGGYLSCETDEEGNGRIGLIALDAALRGHGFGAILLEAGLQWFAERQIKKVTVATQGRNIAAQRLYQKAGFFITEAEAWHHKWFTGIPSHERIQDSV